MNKVSKPKVAEDSPSSSKPGSYGFGSRISKPETPVQQAMTSQQSVEQAPKPVEVYEAPQQVELKVEAPVEAEEVKASLRDNVLSEKENRSKRMRELAALQSKLSESISRKAQIDNAIISEIESLRTDFTREISNEALRLKQLNTLYDDLQNMLIYKNTLLESESKVLLQMVEVRGKISEQTILSQLDIAVEKKQALLEMEEGICAEMRICSGDILAAIKDSNEKVTSFAEALNSLPKSVDAATIRAYSWDEIEKLQRKLLNSIKESENVNEKIEIFISTFDSISKKKGLLLGENTSIPAAVSTKISEIAATATDQSNEEVINATKVQSRQASSSSRASTSMSAIKENLMGQPKEELTATAREALAQSGFSFFVATKRLIELNLHIY